MTTDSGSVDRMVSATVPLLAKSLAEHYSVFRVMHHGTHEKQLSNVFAWLLRENGTHGLGNAFQSTFLHHVNRDLPEGARLPAVGYDVTQEVDTSGREDLGKDIADIVLSRDGACLVIENFATSDGHGHSFDRYYEYGATGNRRSVVVLLCARKEACLQTKGWERAVVVTYSQLLKDLQAHIATQKAWRSAHPRQLCLINDLVERFTGGHDALSNEEQVAFLKAMCDTGESERYGRRPQKEAAKQFSEQMAQHAEHQFEEGRRTLAKVKKALRAFADHTLVDQLSAALEPAKISEVSSRFVGQWEWCVTLQPSGAGRPIFLEFGPTAVVENARAPHPVVNPDYTKVFVTRQAAAGSGIDQIAETSVDLTEVLTGIDGSDVRLRDAVVALLV